ncbi:MAG: Hsp20/alpha crystallin family protein [Acidobacteriota bacterium]
MRSRSLHLEVARIQSEINRLFELLGRLRAGEIPAGDGEWSPPVDVAESETELLVEIELPGVDPDQLTLTTESGQLVVRGMREASAARLEPGASVLHDERGAGRFERAIPLSVAVNPHKAEAVLERGVLAVRLPRVPNRRGAPVAIPVDVRPDTPDSGEGDQR